VLIYRLSPAGYKAISVAEDLPPMADLCLIKWPKLSCTHRTSFE